MTPDERLDKALRSSEPVQELRSLTLELAREGRTKAEILEFFERFLEQLRTRPGLQEADEDAVLDVMDALTGWCHPDARLLAEIGLAGAISVPVENGSFRLRGIDPT